MGTWTMCRTGALAGQVSSRQSERAEAPLLSREMTRHMLYTLHCLIESFHMALDAAAVHPRNMHENNHRGSEQTRRFSFISSSLAEQYEKCAEEAKGCRTTRKASTQMTRAIEMTPISTREDRLT